MTNKPPAFQLYAQDFLVDAAAMTAEAFGAYCRLLFSSWVNESVPDRRIANAIRLSSVSDSERNDGTMAALSRIAVMSLAEFLRVWPMIQANFTCGKDGSYRSRRMEGERKKQAEYRKQRSLAGKNGAAARWNSAMRLPLTDALTDGMANDSSSSSSSSSSSKRINTKTAFEGQILKITEFEDQSFCKAFADVDVAAEYRKMDSWLLANPQKPKKNFARFAHNWLGRIPKPAPKLPGLQELKAPY